MKHGNMDAWCPKNSSDKYGQTRNLKNALANSINTISARLMDQVGPKPVVTLMKKMGIKSYLPEVPSIALGTPDISCLLYTSPSPRDRYGSRMPSSA